MDHALAFEDDGRLCCVRVSGAITADAARRTLRALWQDPHYGAARAALWLLDASPLPALDELLALGAFVVREKGGRGPGTVAIVSPAFGTSVVARAMGGFARAVDLNVNFFASEADARAWLGLRAAA